MNPNNKIINNEYLYKIISKDIIKLNEEYIDIYSSLDYLDYISIEKIKSKYYIYNNYNNEIINIIYKQNNEFIILPIGIICLLCKEVININKGYWNFLGDKYYNVIDSEIKLLRKYKYALSIILSYLYNFNIKNVYIKNNNNNLQLSSIKREVSLNYLDNLIDEKLFWNINYLLTLNLSDIININKKITFKDKTKEEININFSINIIDIIESCKEQIKIENYE